MERSRICEYDGRDDDEEQWRRASDAEEGDNEEELSDTGAYLKENGFDDDEETQERIRKLLNQTSTFSQNESKEAIAHDQRGSIKKEANEHRIKSSMTSHPHRNQGQSKLRQDEHELMRIYAIDECGEIGSQGVNTKLVTKNLSCAEKIENGQVKPRLLYRSISFGKREDEFQGQSKSRNSNDKHSKYQRPDELFKDENQINNGNGKISGRRRRHDNQKLTKSNSVKSGKRRDLRKERPCFHKISSSMSKLSSASQNSLDVDRRSHRGGETNSVGSCMYPHTPYAGDSGNSSVSPSPSPQPPSRRNDIDPTALRRLYWIQRNGGSIGESGNTGSKLNIPNSRPPSVRSAKSTNSSLRGRPPLTQDPLNYSFYRNCRSNSFAFSMDVKNPAPLKDLPPRERRHRKVGYAIIIFSSLLLMLAVLCIVISLHFSSLGEKSGRGQTLNLTTLQINLRKQNEDLLRSIVQTPSSLNVSLSTSSMPTITSPPPAPPESLRETNKNNVISISNLHVHRRTRGTTTLRSTQLKITTTTEPTASRLPALKETDVPKNENEQNKRKILQSQQDSSSLYNKESNSQLGSILEDRDEAFSIPVAAYG